MELKSVLLARAIQFAQVKRTSLYIPRVIDVIKDRYKFVRVPTTVDELLSEENAYQFRHGTFTSQGREIVIHNLTLFQEPVAFLVDVTQTTDNAELVLDDLLGWFLSTFNVELELLGPRDFLSNVEISLTPDLDALCPAVSSEVTKGAAAALAEYYGDGVVFRPYSIGFAVDFGNKAVQLPSDFKVERRANVPFDEHLYFSQAPLRTGAHLGLLARFEEALIRSSTA